MTTEVKHEPDAVLRELWAIKDRRAEQFGDLEHLIEHLRAREKDARSNSSRTALAQPVPRDGLRRA